MLSSRRAASVNTHMLHRSRLTPGSKVQLRPTLSTASLPHFCWLFAFPSKVLRSRAMAHVQRTSHLLSVAYSRSNPTLRKWGDM
eukprot:6481875-Amphidinium_carterae.1